MIRPTKAYIFLVLEISKKVLVTGKDSNFFWVGNNDGTGGLSR